MARAISFGVRCRFAPSTRAIIRSRNVSPGLVVIRMTRRSLVSVVPPVTELRMSVPGSLRTGADSPVMAASLTKPMPSMTSPSPAIVSPASTTMTSPFRSSDDPTLSRRAVGRPPMGGRLRAGLPEGRRLGPAARLGHGLGICGEEDREPQPDGDLDLEAQPGLAGRRGQARSRCATAITVTSAAVISTTNMTGFLIRRRGSSLRNACGQGRPEEVRVEDAARAGRLARTASPRQGSRSAGSGACRARGRPREAPSAEAFPAFWRSCSAIGPRARAGKNVRAPTMITTPIRRTVHSTPVVGNVPRDAATRRLAAIEPARARIGTIIP